MSDLKPCPFCGGEVKIQFDDFADNWNCDTASCRKCSAKTDLNTWNTRTSDEQRIKELEQQSEAVRQHIKTMFPCPIANDGALIVDAGSYNKLVDVLNSKVGDV